jgi:PAS domain S-box-containing protein
VAKRNGDRSSSLSKTKDQLIEELSALKASQEVLRASEERFRNLAEGSIQGIVIHRDDFKPIFANDAYAHIHGFENAGEILALPSIETRFAPRERQRIAKINSECQQGGAVPGRYEFEAIKKDGSPVWLENFVRVIEWQGEPAIQSTVVDITGRKGLVNELRETAWLLNKAQEMSKVGHWRLDATTMEVSGSDELFRIFGINKEDATLDAFVAVVHPEDREYDLGHIQRGLEHGESWDIEHRLQDPKGIIKYVRAAGEARLNEAGEVEGLFGTVQDLTEQKLAEEELTYRQETLEAVLKHLDEGISMVDENLVGVAYNKRFFELLDFPQADFPPGTPYEDFILYNARRGDYGPGDIEEIVRERVEQAKRFEPHRFERTRPDGKVIEVRGNPVPGGGMVTSYIDITDRKLAEQAAFDIELKFSRMLAIAPEAIISTDGRFRIQSFNRAAEQIFGYKIDELLNQPIDMLLPERFRGRHSNLMESFISSEDESRTISDRSEIFGLRKDGTEFSAEASISKLVMGDEIMLTAMLHDITERKKAEFELVAAKEQAEYADRTKSEFLANMSHELRTPLNAIIGFSEIMKQQTFGPLGSPRYEEYSGDIFESGGHLLSLINDILDISKIEAGRVELDEAELDLEIVTQDCLRLIEARSREAGLSIRNEVGRDLTMLWADERLIKQMLLNLLSNAVKFTESGGKITIAAEVAKNGNLKISVTDTGIGIAEKDFPKAMSTFGQIDGALDRKFEGTGLGLPLVESLAELHGGGIQIESEVGAGTKATIWFPKGRVVRVD